MKRFYCLILALLLLPVISLADESDLNAYRITEHYSLLIDGQTITSPKGGRMFDFDSLCIDLYITESHDIAFLSVTIVDSFLRRSSGLQRVTVQSYGNTIYFSDEYGFYMTGQRDENGDGYWINYVGRSFLLRPVSKFSAYSDWK